MSDFSNPNFIENCNNSAGDAENLMLGSDGLAEQLVGTQVVDLSAEMLGFEMSTYDFSLSDATLPKVDLVDVDSNDTEPSTPEATAPEATALQASPSEANAPEAAAPKVSAPLGEPHEIMASLIAATEGAEPGEPVVLSKKKLKKLKRLAAANQVELTEDGKPAIKKLISTLSAKKAVPKPLAQNVAGSSNAVAAETEVSVAKGEQLLEAENDAVTFDSLPLSADVLAAVRASGYDTPTAIQAEIIPHMLEGRDLLAQSQTGTGKTAAFALPILSNMDLRSPALPKALVLAPTRELAIQVAQSFETYAKNLRGFNVTAIYGGQDYEIQFRQLKRGAHVVVGTPGRIIDHIKRGTLDLSGIETLVLDEADEMLNMGFLEDVQFVLEQTPENRQIALFSATLPGPVRSIAERYLNDPVKITIKKKTMTADSIRQRALFVSPREKMDTLCRFLEVEETDGVIIFTKTKDATISVAEALNREGLSAIALNGDMPQKVRERAIEQLKSGRLNILVATDVAARGLDVKRISHVFNFDLPHDSESYIHRVGRTGRAGRAGEAIIFLTPSQRGKLRLIEKATKQPIEVVDPPTADDINAIRVKRFQDSITQATAERDLTVYKELISAYAEESQKPLELIAAALADMAHQGRPFLLKDQAKRSRRERSEANSGGSEDRRGNRYSDSGDSNDFGNKPRGKAGGRSFGPPEAGMQRFRIEVGHRDGVRPGNIVGAIANEAGIDGQFIGPIKILDSFSTIDLPSDLPRELVQTLRNTWVVGKQLRLSPHSNDGGGDRAGRKPGGKPNYAKPAKAKTYGDAKVQGESGPNTGSYAKPPKPSAGRPATGGKPGKPAMAGKSGKPGKAKKRKAKADQ